jgi:hypothetical protein
MFMRKPRRLLAMFAMALLVSFTVACDDDDATDPEEDAADRIVTMRLAVGLQVINVRRVDGNVTGGPIAIGAGATNISATFLDASGNTMAGLDEFELRVTSGNTAFVTFNRVSTFAGTLVRVAPGNTTLNVGLFHPGEGHFDVGAFPIPIIVS